MAILQVEGIQKRFGKTRVLENISFELEQGQALAIIGSSGSGKTTLLRCLNFLERPDQGRITVGGQVLFDAGDPNTQRESEVRKKRLHFGLVFQSFNLFPQYTALDNVTLAGRLLAREPVTGAGLGADAVRQAVRLNSLYQGAAPFVHAHNTFLQIWAETGLVGLLSFLGSIFWTMKETARAVKTCRDPAARHLAIGGTAAILGSMVCGLADYLWTYPRIMFVFWFVFALTLAAIKVCKAETDRV